MSENQTQPDLVKAVDQLRTLVCGLGVIVFIVSLSFGAFVWKQTRNISSVAVARKAQINQLQSNLNAMGTVANDLLNYSANRPELMAIFHNHNIDVKAKPAPAPKLER